MTSSFEILTFIFVLFGKMSLKRVDKLQKHLLTCYVALNIFMFLCATLLQLGTPLDCRDDASDIF